MTDVLTAEHFLQRLMEHQSDDELRKIQRYFKTGEGDYAEGDVFVGVRMGTVFQLAKEFIAMPVTEIEKLLESNLHEARAGACSIMGKSAAAKKTPESRRRELYDLYLRRHDRINNWDLVDLCGHHVVGGWLLDKPRDVLYALAASESPWERRTAIFATAHFIRHGQLDDTFKIAELLAHDPHELVQKATGWMLRAAGDQDPARLRQFLDQHAPTTGRTLLRSAIEHLDKDERAHYLGLKARPA